MTSCHRAILACALALCASPPLLAGSNSWVEVHSPHFVVVSNAGEKQARKTALQFEQIRAVFRQALPALQNQQTPVITILAVTDEKSLSQLLPEYWATKGRMHPAGIFENAMDQFYIAVELDAHGTNPYETIYHEYFHSLSTPYLPNMPTWLAEGMADFFGNSEVDGKTAMVGEPSQALLYQLQSSSLIPLDTLFKVDQSSPYYNESSKTTMFYAESWALVHYLMVGDKQGHRALFEAYLSALNDGKTGDQAAAKAFGDLKKLQRNLQDYISNNTFYRIEYPTPPSVSPSDLTAANISEAEAEAYRGGFLAVRGRTDEGVTALRHALQLDPKNARVYRNLAIAQFFSGAHEDALASATKAIELAPGDTLTLYIRAYLSFSSDPGKADPETEADLRKAIAASPEYAPPYALLAVYLTNQDKNLPEALDFAAKAISVEPGNAEYRLAQAQTLLRMGKYSEARQAGMRARTAASSAQELLHTEMFLTSVDTMERYANRASESTRPPEEKTADTSSSSEPPPRLKHREASSDAVEATGVVSEVDCKNGFQMKLGVSTGVLTLRGSALRIESSSAIPKDFSPCSLKGQRVTVDYRPDGPNSQTGTMELLRLLDSKNSPQN